MTTFPDIIPMGRTSITDKDDWRTFCQNAAADLTMIRDGDGILERTIEGISYATRRYERIADRLEGMFGSWEGWRILEVGGGYGGQAKIMLDRHPCDYSIIDLPEPASLQHAYLESVGYTLADVHLPGDLFISNYALSECRLAEQRKYARLAVRCARGYITWNGWSHSTSFSRSQLAALIPGSRWEAELPHPNAHPLNGCLVWGDL